MCVNNSEKNNNFPLINTNENMEFILNNHNMTNTFG